MPRSTAYRNMKQNNTRMYSNNSTGYTRNMSDHLPAQNKNNSVYAQNTQSTNPSFAQTLKEGFGFGMGSSAGQIMMYNILGFPKVNVEHKYTNDNIMPCNTTKNCSEIFLEFEKCKGDWNCNHDKFDQLKNEYEKCQNKQQ